jgi:hypothetical protein
MAYRSRSGPCAFTAPAKIAGTCRDCQQPFAVGETIHFTPVRGQWDKRHTKCQDSALREAQARGAAQQAEQTRIAALLDWKQSVTIERASCERWTDAVPATAEATDEELVKSARMNDSGGYLALRRYYHRYLGRDAQGRALIEVSEFLAD